MEGDQQGDAGPQPALGGSAPTITGVTSPSTRRFHIHELQRLTGIRALEGQARILMNDLREYRAWLEWFEKRSIDRTDGAQRWLADVYEPTIDRLRGAVGTSRDLVQAYCDVLEHKWLLSEEAGVDVGLERAIASYLAIGAPAPEVGVELDDPALAADPDPIAGGDVGLT